MRGDIVSEGGVDLFLLHKEFDVLIEVFCHHLGVGVGEGFRFGFDGFGEDDGSVAGGDGCSELVEFVVVDEGVVSFVAVVVFVVEEVGEFPSEDSVFHVSVRLVL